MQLWLISPPPPPWRTGLHQSKSKRTKNGINLKEAMVVSAGIPGRGARGGDHPCCLVIGGERGAKVPFSQKSP